MGRRCGLFPPNRGLGQSPNLNPEKFRGTSKILAIDHDQLEFLGPDAPGLQSPQIDHQLPADGHHSLFLQRPVGTPQDFLPFLHRLVLGLKEDNPPDRLGDNPPNGRYTYLGNRPQPLAVSGAPFTGHHAWPSKQSCVDYCKGSNSAPRLTIEPGWPLPLLWAVIPGSAGPRQLWPVGFFHPELAADPPSS